MCTASCIISSEKTPTETNLLSPLIEDGGLPD